MNTLILKASAILLLLVALAGWHVHAVNGARAEGHAHAVAERAAADLTAVVARTVENKVLADQQHTINLELTKEKDEQLAPVRARIAADRVRVGPALCNGTASPPAPEGARGSDGPDSSAGLVQPGVERDFRALMLAVEEDLATGRACQGFIEKNGLVP